MEGLDVEIKGKGELKVLLDIWGRGIKWYFSLIKVMKDCYLREEMKSSVWGILNLKAFCNRQVEVSHCSLELGRSSVNLMDLGNVSSRWKLRSEE